MLFGELPREHDLALSVHAPLFGWVGHLEASGRKWSSALGALDRSAGIAARSGAEVVVFHPGFLLGRTREHSIDAVVEQLDARQGATRGELVVAVPFGIEVMGRVRDLGSLDDLRGDQPWVPDGSGRWIDFAHINATSDGAFMERRALPRGPRARGRGARARTRRSRFHSRTSRTPTATRRSTCPTATARCVPTRSARRSTVSSGPRR